MLKQQNIKVIMYHPAVHIFRQYGIRGSSITLLRKYFDIQESSDAEEFLSLDELGRVLSRITRILRQGKMRT